MMQPANQNFPDSPVLILAPMGNDARNAAGVLAKLSIRSVLCPTMAELCRRAGPESGAFLISEEVFDQPSLAALVDFLIHQPTWSDMPIVLLTKAGEIDQKTFNILNFLGARANVTLLEKPLRAITLISVVKAALRSRQHQFEVRKQLENYENALEGIAASEQRYRTLFDSMMEGFCIIEVLFDEHQKPHDLRYLQVNPAFEGHTGLKDAAGKRLKELAPDIEQSWFDAYGHVALTGKPARFENRVASLDRWFEVFAVRLDPPESRRVAVMFNEVTERKKAEEILRQNEALFSSLVNLAPTGVYVVDAHFRLQQINPLAMPAFAQVKPAVGRDFSEAMHILWGKEVGDEIVKIFRHTLETGERYISPRFSEFRHDLGMEMAYEWETQQVKLPNGEHGVVCYFNDITERERDAERLRISEERLRMAAQASGFGVHDHDVLKNISVWSPELFALCGIEPGTPVTMETITRLCHADDRERTWNAMQASFQPEGTGSFAEEFRIIRPDNGDVRWFFKRWQTFFAGQGPERRAVRAIGVVLDITDRKRAENALKEANFQLADKAALLESQVRQRTAKLQETVGELEAFSYSIAHDLRSPLRALQGFSDILLEEYGNKIGTEGQDYLSRIANAATRLDKLIRDVLDYSRVVRAEYPLETVELEPLLRDIIDTYPMLAPEKAEIELAGTFPAVLGNQAMLTQIFSNLMGNAVKFVPAGVKPRLKLWTEPYESRLRVFVQDNGIGIAEGQQKKIFDIFQQLDQNYEGTGIGLAIVKKAVERIGGMVGLQSEPGKGSTFWIELKPA